MKFFYLSALILLLACSSPAPKALETAAVPDSSATSETSAIVASDLQPLQEATTTHIFSSRTAPDQFRLQLRGDSVLTGMLGLSIVSAAGDTLLRDQFPATALLDYGLSSQYGENPTATQRAAYIRQRINSFFAADKFSNPAIKPEETFDEDYSSKIIWQEVKQMELPGFFYNLYEEDGRRMAYSRRLGKAVMYRNCC